MLLLPPKNSKSDQPPPTTLTSILETQENPNVQPPTMSTQKTRDIKNLNHRITNIDLAPPTCRDESKNQFATQILKRTQIKRIRNPKCKNLNPQIPNFRNPKSWPSRPTNHKEQRQKKTSKSQGRKPHAISLHNEPSCLPPKKRPYIASRTREKKEEEEEEEESHILAPRTKNGEKEKKGTSPINISAHETEKPHEIDFFSKRETKHWGLNEGSLSLKLEKKIKYK